MKKKEKEKMDDMEMKKKEDMVEYGMVDVEDEGELGDSGDEKDEEKDEEAKEKEQDLSDKLSAEEMKKLAEQCDKEYRYCIDYMRPKIQEWLKRLKLYNNQRRAKDKVGDPLLFTVLQTVLASLYSDQIQVDFKGREEGDYKDSTLLNATFEFDYDEMEKDIVDYEWIWDSLFFGRGLVEFTHFDRETMTPVPRVIDPTNFLRDPRATSVRGSKLGDGAMRFGGEELALTKWQMEQNKAFFNLSCLDEDFDKNKDIGADFNSLLTESRQARAEAVGTQSGEIVHERDIGDNRQYDIVKWYTHYKGKKCVVYLSPGRREVIRYHVIKSKHFPIFDRPLYPTSHDWDGTSIPDITEDKQRLRAILINAVADIAKGEAYPMVIYNRDKIKNRADLDFSFNKAIGVPGSPSDVVAPFNKPNVNSIVIDYVLQTLDAAAQKATATPEIQQGAMSDQQRTLGELELIASKSSTRYSLAAKVFGWTEKRFAQHWYWMYKQYMQEDVDEKFVRISGAYGDENRWLTKDQIVREVDPDIKVTSKSVSESENIRQQMRFEKFLNVALQDQTANVRYLRKKYARYSNLKPDEIDRAFPLTAQELIASDENKSLSENKLVPIKDNDNHVVHMEMHSMAAETPAKKAHIKAHRDAIRLMSQNPNLFPDMDPGVFQQAGMSAPALNVAKTGAMEQQSQQQPQPAPQGQAQTMPQGGLT